MLTILYFTSLQFKLDEFVKAYDEGVKRGIMVRHWPCLIINKKVIVPLKSGIRHINVLHTLCCIKFQQETCDRIFTHLRIYSVTLFNVFVNHLHHIVFVSNYNIANTIGSNPFADDPRYISRFTAKGSEASPGNVILDLNLYVELCIYWGRQIIYQTNLAD